MSKKGYTLAFSKIASAVLAVVLVCGMAPVANASNEDAASQPEPAYSIATENESLENPAPIVEDSVIEAPVTENESVEPSAPIVEDSVVEAPATESESVPSQNNPVPLSPSNDPAGGLVPMSDPIYTIASFVGYVDAVHPLQTIEIMHQEKSTEAALNLPTTLAVVLDNTTTVNVPVTWTCRVDYENTDDEVYTFDPTLDQDYGLAAGVVLPYLEVKVASARRVVSPGDWIEAARTWIKGTHTADTQWDAYMGEQFFKSMGYNEDGMNWASLKWRTDVTAGIPAWDGTTAFIANTGQTDPQTNPKMIPYYDATTQTYEVWSANQLLYALRNVNATATANDPIGYTVHIMRDIDFNGTNGVLWPVDVTLPQDARVVLDGDTGSGPAKLFNLFQWRQSDAEAQALGDTSGDGNGSTGLISSAGALKAQNLDFRGANIQGLGNTSSGSPYQGTAVLLGFGQDYKGTIAVDTGYENITFEDSYVVGRSSYTSTLVGRDQGSNAKIGVKAHTLDNCSSKSTYIIGGYHCGGLTGAIIYYDLISRSFVVDTTVMTYGGHSGGLFSCVSGVGTISKCFADANVYSLKEAGVFAGNLGDSHVYNCFTSGFVEGSEKLGGFIGATNSKGTTQTIVNCYSTALVGLSSEGKSMGGFVGSVTNASGYNTGFINCYAAGEVGSAMTDSTSNGPTRTDMVGGFAGDAAGLLNTSGGNNTRCVAGYCYYDKQTTAMREWGQGIYKGAYENLTYTQAVLNNSINPLIVRGILTPGDPGIKGVLTTTTDKAGTGLTADPTGSTDGFIEFIDLNDFYKNVTSTESSDKTPVLYSDYGWDYSATDHYPELVCFSENTETAWDPEDLDLVKAYSKSSTSTAALETWEKGLDASTGNSSGSVLPATTYDTVRDITVRFNLSNTEVVNWATTDTQDGIPGTQAVTIIKGKTKNVLELFNESGWYASQFAPGMEWLQVTTSSNGTEATRRFRVTPSAGLDAGESKNVYATVNDPTATYDHADDVVFYFTTAERWAEHDYDVTTGVYPDTSPDGTTFPAGGERTPDALTADQTLFANGANASLFDSFFGSDPGGTDTNDHYGVILQPDDTKLYPGVDMSYMARNYDDPIDENNAVSENAATGSKVFTYIRPIEYFDENNNNKIVTGDVLDMTIMANSDSFNGYKEFESENTQYLVEYVWELADGRLVRDAKIITVKSLPFDVKIDAYESGAINATVAAQKDALHDSDDALVGAVANVTDVETEVDFSSDVNNRTTDTAQAGVGEHVVVGWAVTNPLKQVNQIKVDFIFEPLVTDGQAQHYHATLNNPQAGDTITIPYKFWRIVTLENGEYYSVPQLINRVYTVGEKVENGVTYQYLFFNKDMVDEETGIKVLDMEDDAQVDVELSEVLILHKSIEGTYADKTKTFDFDVYYTDDVARADEDNHAGNTYTYLLWDDKGTPDDYSDDVQVMSGTNPVTGTITAYDTSPATKSGTVSLTDNQYISIVGGTVGDAYEFKEAGATDYTTTVLAEDGTLVGKTAAATTHDQWKKYASLLTDTALTTGTLTLPELAKEEPASSGTYVSVPADYSRTMFTNTYAQITPSGIKTEANWLWWLIATIVLMVSLGSGSAIYRNNHLGKVAVQGRHSSAAVQGRHSSVAVQGKHSKAAVQRRHSGVAVQGKHGIK